MWSIAREKKTRRMVWTSCAYFVMMDIWEVVNDLWGIGNGVWGKDSWCMWYSIWGKVQLCIGTCHRHISKYYFMLTTSINCKLPNVWKIMSSKFKHFFFIYKFFFNLKYMQWRSFCIAIYVFQILVFCTNSNDISERKSETAYYLCKHFSFWHWYCLSFHLRSSDCPCGIVNPFLMVKSRYLFYVQYSNFLLY